MNTKLRDSKDSAECNWAEIWSHYDLNIWLIPNDILSLFFAVATRCVCL